MATRKKKRYKSYIGISVTPNMYDFFEQKAEEENLYKSQLFRKIMREYYGYEEKKSERN